MRETDVVSMRETYVSSGEEKAVISMRETCHQHKGEMSTGMMRTAVISMTDTV